MFSCLDTSIVSTALVSVSVEYQNYQDTPWTVLGYLLTYMSELDGTRSVSGSVLRAGMWQYAKIPFAAPQALPWASLS